MTEQPPTTIIRAPRLFDGVGWMTDAEVRVTAGIVTTLGPACNSALTAETTVLPEGTVLAPGFVDLQVNGGGGVLFADAPEPATVRAMVAAHRRLGTTGMLPTLITSAPEKLARLAETARDIAQIPGVIGVHLEGPFLNRARKGVHAAAFLRAPTADDVRAIEAIARETRVVLTLAPECVPEGFIRTLRDLGVVVAIGHSDASGAVARAAIADGATLVTHLYNAMSQLTPREPGVVGVALDDGAITAGLICDGIHVGPQALRIAFRALGAGRLALVTDAMPTVGSPVPTFRLDGRDVRLRDGRLSTEEGTLAGAHLGMIEAVRNAVTLMGASLQDALAMASRTPATALGLAPPRGRIAAGCPADLVAIASDYNVLRTWIGGRIA